MCKGEQCFSKGPKWTSSVSIPWKSLEDPSLGPIWPYWVSPAGDGPSNLNLEGPPDVLATPIRLEPTELDCP